MSEQDPIRVFVTHEFADSEHYARVFEYLESREGFYYLTCSRPEDIPAGGQEAMQEALRNQIKQSEVVIYPVGIASDSSALLRFQLKAAQAFGRPILAIQAFGGTISISQEILAMAADMVEWNDRIITDALRHLARGDDTQTLDVIEFDMD